MVKCANMSQREKRGNLRRVRHKVMRIQGFGPVELPLEPLNLQAQSHLAGENNHTAPPHPRTQARKAEAFPALCMSNQPYRVSIGSVPFILLTMYRKLTYLFWSRDHCHVPNEASGAQLYHNILYKKNRVEYPCCGLLHHMALVANS
jgi:hypothetical protein